MHNFM